MRACASARRSRRAAVNRRLRAAWWQQHGCHAALVRPDHVVFGVAGTAAELRTLLAEHRAQTLGSDGGDMAVASRRRRIGDRINDRIDDGIVKHIDKHIGNRKETSAC